MTKKLKENGRHPLVLNLYQLKEEKKSENHENTLHRFIVFFNHTF